MFSQDGTTVATFNQDQPAFQALAAPAGAGADADPHPWDWRLDHPVQRGPSGGPSLIGHRGSIPPP